MCSTISACNLDGTPAFFSAMPPAHGESILSCNASNSAEKGRASRSLAELLFFFLEAENRRVDLPPRQSV